MSGQQCHDVEAPLPTYEEAVAAPKYSSIFGNLVPVRPARAAPRESRTSGVSDLAGVHGERRVRREHRVNRNIPYDLRGYSQGTQKVWRVIWALATVLILFAICLIMSPFQRRH